MKNRPVESNRIELEKEDIAVGFVVGLVLALLVAGIPVAEATDTTLSIRSGEIPQGHIHHYPAAQGHIDYTKPNAVQKPNGPPSSGAAGDRHSAADLLCRAAALRGPWLLELHLGAAALRQLRVGTGQLQL